MCLLSFETSSLLFYCFRFYFLLMMDIAKSETFKNFIILNKALLFLIKLSKTAVQSVPKIHNNVLSFANSDKFNLIKNCYTHKTRLSHKNNFFLPRTRTRLGQKSPSFAGIKVWNEIPSSIKEVSFYRFKKAVKAHFLSNYEIDKS